MSGYLRGVFGLLASAILMATLYMVFFGVGNWKGVLMYASEKLEQPISNYYYKYCYTPYIHANNDVDRALGGNVKKDIYGSVYQVESNLSLDGISENTTFANGGTYKHYSTGWN